jgi:holo-[acyl-carrier protein] synthase
MIYGIGTDLLLVARTERLWVKYGEHFAGKILMPEERTQFARSRKPGNFLAKCFAAKEAFVKALGTGFRGVGYQDAGVVHLPSGKPTLAFSPAMRARLDGLGIHDGHVSLTDEDGRVLAFVVLECSPGQPAP